MLKIIDDRHLINIANAIREKTGSTENLTLSEMSTQIEDIPTGGGDDAKPSFTGSYDVAGLKQLGYDDETINEYNKYVSWNKEDNDKFLLTDYDKNITIKQYYDLLSNKNVRYVPFIDTSTITNMASGFANCYQLKTIPKIEMNKVTYAASLFNNCRSLKTIPLLNISNCTVIQSMFYNCYNLKNIPLLNTSKVTNMSGMFYNCYNLTNIPLLDISKVTDMNTVFYNCYSLKEIPLLNTINVTSMNNTFYYCYSLEVLPLLNTSKVTNMSSMFYNCASLKIIPEIDTSNVTSVAYMFSSCYSLEVLPLLNASKFNDLSNMFNMCSSLIRIKGFANLGQNYNVGRPANDSYYELKLTASNNLTHESLMNIINNVYDIKSKGCNTQKITFGSTNLSKLTAEEIAIATTKGWTVS